LSTESWEDISEGSDINVIFNNYLNIHLKIFYAFFTKSKLNFINTYIPYITRGIKVSCHIKQILYICYSESNDTNLKVQY